MKPKRNNKRVPSFRKLLKTSKVKLDNKLKNKQFKQQNSSKKHRKEQKQLREALRDAKSRIHHPLEQPKKKDKAEDDEDEMEEEALPLDMIEDDDLEMMKDMARRASFLTRDLSSSEPVHARKRKEQNVIGKYEKVPRRMQMEPEKDLIHLLPIKDKRGIIPQSMEKPVAPTEEEEEEKEEPEEAVEEYKEEPLPVLTTEEIILQRKTQLHEKKIKIATLSSSILSDPENSVKKLKELRSMLMEQDPNVAVTVRKLVMVSLTEVFKDITPSYKIRPLTEAEKASKVKKETQKLREFEEGLVCQYKFFLENLEQTVKDWKQMKLKKSDAVSLKAYKGLAEVAVKCLCELMLSLSHFNFHNNIIVMIVPLMNDKSKRISEMCCEAIKKLFKQDRVGYAALSAVKVISGIVKSRNYDVRPEMLQVLLHLRIKEVEVKKDTEDLTAKKKFMTFKEKRKSLSRMQRKWKKAEEKLERELLEAEASESKEKKLKLHTETLNIVFLTYFRILKRAQKSLLLPAVLEGLAKFAHLINVEFFDDLLAVLHTLVASGDLSYRESLHCVQTAFNILSGQGDVLNIDPLKFYNHLYKTLFGLHAGSTNDDVLIVLHCLDVMLTKRRKQVSHQRALAFIKRLSTLALHVLPNSCIGILSTNRTLLHTFPRADILLDNESQGSGLYLPEMDEPEFCNAQNTALWELHSLQPIILIYTAYYDTVGLPLRQRGMIQACESMKDTNTGERELQRHYHPVVKRFAAHLCAGAPAEGSEALKHDLGRRSAVELFDDYSTKGMTFNPPVAPCTTKKKASFMEKDSYLSEDLKELIKSHPINSSIKMQLDYAQHLQAKLCN